MKRFIKATALMLALMLCILSMPLMAASADSMYIIPDSDKRALTYAELWNYQYDTLMYAFNEIYARHGIGHRAGIPNVIMRAFPSAPRLRTTTWT